MRGFEGVTSSRQCRRCLWLFKVKDMFGVLSWPLGMYARRGFLRSASRSNVS